MDTLNEVQTQEINVAFQLLVSVDDLKKEDPEYMEFRKPKSQEGAGFSDLYGSDGLILVARGAGAHAFWQGLIMGDKEDYSGLQSWINGIEYARAYAGMADIEPSPGLLASVSVRVACAYLGYAIMQAQIPGDYSLVCQLIRQAANEVSQNAFFEWFEFMKIVSQIIPPLDNELKQKVFKLEREMKEIQTQAEALGEDADRVNAELQLLEDSHDDVHEVQALDRELKDYERALQDCSKKYGELEAAWKKLVHWG